MLVLVQAFVLALVERLGRDLCLDLARVHLRQARQQLQQVVAQRAADAACTSTSISTRVPARTFANPIARRSNISESHSETRVLEYPFIGPYKRVLKGTLRVQGRAAGRGRGAPAE